MGIFTRKPISALLAQAAEDGEQSMPRSLGARHVVALGVGVTIGAGIFVLTGQAAAQHAGPAVVLSFVIAAVACSLAALCYAELASMIPVSGSAYTYAYAAFGEIVAWIIAWDLIVEYLVAAGAVAVGWSGYFSALLAQAGLPLPPEFSQAPLMLADGHRLALSGAVVNLPAVAIVALAGAMLLWGTRQSARLNQFIVGLKVGVILLVIAFGLRHVDPGHWTPFIPPETVDPITGQSRYGYAGVLAGAGVVFFAFLGFEAVSTAAQEVREPQRNMPIGILGSLAICTVLYILVSLVVTGLAPLDALDVPAPLYAAIDAVGPALAWLKPFVSLGATVGLASTVLILIYGQSRIFYAMSRDGLLPAVFGRLHPARRTPTAATAVTTAAAAVLAGVMPIDLLGQLVSVGTLLSFALICLGVMVLRLRHPEQPRAFKAPVWPVTCALGAGLCLYLAASLPASSIARLAAWFAIGMVVYFGYARRRSKLSQAAVTAAATAP